MKKHIPKILLILILLLLAAGAVFLVRQRKSELSGMETVPAPALPVSVSEVKTGAVEQTRHYLGIIEPVVSARIAAQVTGYLDSVHVDTGDRVRKNQVIAEIDDRLLKKELSGLEAELKGAKADLADLKQRYERRKELYQKGHATEESLEAAQSAFVSARSRVSALGARIESARVSLGYATIQAPFDGVVTRRDKDPGDLVTPGQVLYQIENTAGAYRVLVHLDAQTADRISKHTTAEIRHGSSTIEAPVDQIYPAGDENRMAVAEIRLPVKPFNLPSMTFVGVDLVFGASEALVVPRQAALEYEGQWRVFVLRDDQRATPVDVDISAFGKNRLAVISEKLRPADRVIVGDESMLIRLGENTRVTPVNARGTREAE
ncbi:MAG: efflux RND transporter periplasmic adaptor subunit [Desulfosalsimonas sp.]|uniref:efflux RND transporter periplasmic adaptor subunit n=1 Tax=Desulfosalsimonas sp. TaxID=3073848 RepID=UPI00397052FA